MPLKRLPGPLNSGRAEIVGVIVGKAHCVRMERRQIFQTCGWSSDDFTESGERARGESAYIQRSFEIEEARVDVVQVPG